MTVSTRNIVLLGFVAAIAPFGACSGYTNLGDPPAEDAGGDAGNGNETGGTGGPSTSSGGTSAATGNGGSSTSRGGRSAGGSSTSGGGAAGTGGGSTGGEATGGAGPDSGGSAGSGGSGTPDGGAPDLDGGVPDDASTGDAAMPGDGGGDTGCELDACNDHGACIERERWTLCDCAVDRLPTCELPLFRESGPSRTGDELILVSVSGDGTTIVGSHRPYASLEPKFGVMWTLDGGLVALPQDPAGPTVATSANFDASLIRGRVETPEGTILHSVVWRNGVLGTPSAEDDDPREQPRRPPTVAELTQMLVDLGIDARIWDIWVVNDISDDGKVIFGLGLHPLRSARWLLRLP